MWIRRMVLGTAIASGVGFGFVLSSCMPPVDGQASDFPRLTIGESYNVRFSASFGGSGGGSMSGVLKSMGPYPWIGLEVNARVMYVNMESVALIDASNNNG